jgi:hypothetical protein
VCHTYAVTEICGLARLALEVRDRRCRLSAAVLAALPHAAVYRTGGWPAEVDGDAFTAPFNAPSAGPPPWYLYRLTLHTAVGVASAEPHGATRWDIAH